MARNFKQRLADGELVRVFALGRVLHPIVVEMFARAGGYDGFWLDQEHTSAASDQIITAALAARANQFELFVRVPPTGYWQVTQCLEAGAGGVMAAQIHTLEQAEQFAAWAKFSPAGSRGLNASGADADYTYKPPAQFVADANRDSFVAIQVETLGAVEAAPAIAALPDVDLLFIGPADLSLALGVVGQFHHDKLWEAIAEVATACQRRGKAWGCVAPDPQFAARALELGCRMPTYGNEILALRRGIESIREAFADQFDDR